MTLLNKRNIKAVIYARVSSKDQEREGFSIPAQIKLLTQYAEQSGFEIVRVFEEVETAKVTGRPTFAEMLAFLKNPKNNCKVILVEKTDRLYRNIKDWVVIDELDIDLHFVKEGEIISRNVHSSKKFLHGIRVLMAKNYVDNLSEEVRKGTREKASQGLYPGGYVPLGYIHDKNTKQIFLDPLRAPLIREMFELYADRKLSLRALVKWTRTKGLTMRRSGNYLTLAQVERMLKNPFYRGQFYWAGQLYQGKQEPIVSPVLFERTRLAFESNNRPYQNKRQFAFSNLMTCAVCGCKIIAEIKKGRYVYYHCTGMRGGCNLVYVPEPKLVDQFGALIEPLALTQDQAGQIMGHFQKKNGKEQDQAKNQRRAFSMTLGRIKRWSEQAYIDKLEGKITEAQWLNMYRKWENESLELEAQLRALDSTGIQAGLTVNRVLELAQRLPDIWIKRNAEEKRQIVDLLYSNCQLEGATLRATYSKPFSYIAKGPHFDIQRNSIDNLGTYISSLTDEDSERLDLALQAVMG